MYRFAQYENPYAHVIAPRLNWSIGNHILGTYLFVTVPEFGPVLITPQLRLSVYFNYFWRLSIWSLYGYETVNDRFVDPSRQSPQVSTFVQVRHLFNDWTGLNVGVSYAHFLSDTVDAAQERFNQDRLELSMHVFYRFPSR